MDAKASHVKILIYIYVIELAYPGNYARTGYINVLLSAYVESIIQQRLILTDVRNRSQVDAQAFNHCPLLVL